MRNVVGESSDAFSGRMWQRDRAHSKKNPRQVRRGFGVSQRGVTGLSWEVGKDGETQKRVEKG